VSPLVVPLVLPLLLPLVLAAGCALPAPREGSDRVVLLRHGAMGCLFEIAIHDVDEERAGVLARKAVAEIDRVDRALSSWDETSELARLNRLGGKGPVRVGALLFETVARSLQLSTQTQGAFDVTVGPLVDAYGFRGGTPRVPPDAELAELRWLVGPARVRLEPSSAEISFDRPGVRLDLDGIGKGVAVDRVAALLREGGVADATISAGGSTVCAIGPPASRPPRIVSVEGPAGTTDACVSLRDLALSTSGNWRNRIEVGGRFYGHVLDPRAGRPAERGVLSATVVVDRAVDSEALAKACVVLGADEAEKIARRWPAEVVLLTSGARGTVEVVRFPAARGNR
jgi:FAD:protein FMN transferase